MTISFNIFNYFSTTLVFNFIIFILTIYHIFILFIWKLLIRYMLMVIWCIKIRLKMICVLVSHLRKISYFEYRAFHIFLFFMMFLIWRNVTIILFIFIVINVSKIGRLLINIIKRTATLILLTRVLLLVSILNAVFISSSIMDFSEIRTTHKG